MIGSIGKLLAEKCKKEAVAIGKKAIGIRTTLRRELLVRTIKEVGAIITNEKVVNSGNHSKSFQNGIEDR